MLKVKYFSFSKKLFVLFCIPFVIISLFTTLLCSMMLKKNLSSDIKESLRTMAYSLDSAYGNFYEGDYSRDKSFRLFKGNQKITGDTGFLDKIQEQTGVETSFYYENQIVVTTLKRDAGGRAVGLSLEPEIYQKLQNGEDVFYEGYELEGSTYFGYFIPLRNEDTVVGAIFAGRKSQEVVQQIERQIQMMVILLVGIMLVFLGLLIFFARWLSASMKRTASFLKKVAGGDLGVLGQETEVRNHDEIGDIYRNAQYLRAELRDIVGNIKDSAAALSDSAGDLKKMSFNVHQSVNHMHGRVSEIVEDAEVQAKETDSAVKNISAIAGQIEAVTKEMEFMQAHISSMAEAESNSSRHMSDFSDMNADMMEAVDEIASQVMITNNSVQKIQNTIDIIRSVADETNLLSVNASIEAAHAGETGRGFAVIAEEINRMAGQSAQHAVDVENTIAALKEESEKMVEAMDKVKNVMQKQSACLEETLANVQVVEQGVDSSRTSVISVKGHMEGITDAKEIILENIKNQAAIADKFVVTMEKVTEKVSEIDVRMRELEQTADSLDVISAGLCSGLDIFKM